MSANEKTFRVESVPITSIEISPLKFRREQRPTDVGDLAQSCAQVGLIQPVVVREAANGSYELLVGEHRLEAARQAGLGAILAVVVAADDKTATLLSIESDLRVYPLSPAERAKALAEAKKLYEAEHGKAKRGRPRKNVSPHDHFGGWMVKSTKKSRATVYRDLARQLKLAHEVGQALEAKRITQSHAQQLARLPADQQSVLLPQVVGKTRDETRELVSRVLSASTPEHAARASGEAAPDALALVKGACAVFLSACDAFQRGLDEAAAQLQDAHAAPPASDTAETEGVIRDFFKSWGARGGPLNSATEAVLAQIRSFLPSPVPPSKETATVSSFQNDQVDR